MTRYFMTIPEAVQLIIQAGAIGKSGDIYVLDMGTPVRILDLAHNMITLAGYEPEVDVAIEFIGPRPGEKLHEELFNVDERAEPTSAERIVRAVRTFRCAHAARTCRTQRRALEYAPSYRSGVRPSCTG
jgi:FlaA1/EpsC-like NDP-sugar epimerase